jgi:diguanylate cyclase (GGDEF)-like protein
VIDERSLHVARQLKRAQDGTHSTVLEETERELRRATGDLADGDAGLHFVRVVSLMRAGRPADVLPGADLMRAAAVRDGTHGWLSCALSLQALLVIEQEGRERGHHDAEAALRGLLAAEAALEKADDDPVQRCNAHANLGIGFDVLRLYELAQPHHEAAHTESLRVPDGRANPSMWSTNLSLTHLQWALELYRVGEVAEAERHTAEAARVAGLALGEAREWADERHVTMVELHRDCALADGPSVEGVADRLIASVERVRAFGAQDLAHFAAPFLAVALNRAGRRKEALACIDRAWQEVDRHANLMNDAAITHTRAELLAQAGDAGAAAALEYGNVMARLLWRERLRSLHAARTMRDFESLRTAHEEVAASAVTDALTGLANRRALDEQVERLAEAGDRDVGVLLIDLDRFKQINDTLGHDAGDDALRRVARAVSAVVRAGDTVARLGGDEFAVLLPGASPASAAAVAERAVRAVADLGTGSTISVGVAVRVASEVREALTVADAAMYVAKRAGGGRLQLGD